MREDAGLDGRKRFFPTADDWLLEQGVDLTSRRDEIEHSLGEELRDALETMHSPKCAEDLCHPTCDFTLLLAYWYERLSYREIADRYGWKGKQSAKYRLDMAQNRLKERMIEMMGEDPYE